MLSAYNVNNWNNRMMTYIFKKINGDVVSLITAHNSLITYNRVAIFYDIEIPDPFP